MESRDAVATAITGVVLDYFEGWFQGDTQRMRGAIHPQLAKRTLADGGTAAHLSHTTAARMLELTTAGDGIDEDPGGDRGIEIEVIDVHANIAAVVVRSTVYREYLHLVDTADEGWRIVNAVWHAT